MMLANLAGVLCDGAKATCSLKAGTTALEAYLVALFALKGETSPGQGIVGASIDKRRVTKDSSDEWQDCEW